MEPWITAGEGTAERAAIKKIKIWRTINTKKIGKNPKTPIVPVVHQTVSTILDLWGHITLHYDNSIKVPSCHLIFAVSQLNYQQVQAEMDFYSWEIKLHTLPSLPLS